LVYHYDTAHSWEILLVHSCTWNTCMMVLFSWMVDIDGKFSHFFKLLVLLFCCFTKWHMKNSWNVSSYYLVILGLDIVFMTCSHHLTCCFMKLNLEICGLSGYEWIRIDELTPAISSGQKKTVTGHLTVPLPVVGTLLIQTVYITLHVVVHNYHFGSPDLGSICLLWCVEETKKTVLLFFERCKRRAILCKSIQRRHNSSGFWWHEFFQHLPFILLQNSDISRPYSLQFLEFNGRDPAVCCNISVCSFDWLSQRMACIGLAHFCLFL
jgi:hypothetical protein